MTVFGLPTADVRQSQRVFLVTRMFQWALGALATPHVFLPEAAGGTGITNLFNQVHGYSEWLVK